MVGFALTFIVLLSAKLIQTTPFGNRDDLQDQEIAEMKKMMTLQSQLIQSQAEVLQEYGERIASLEKEHTDLVKQTEQLRTANEVKESRLTHLDREVDMDTCPEEDVHVASGQSTEKFEDPDQLHKPVNQGEAVQEDDGNLPRIRRVANVPEHNLNAVGFYCRLGSPGHLLLGQHQAVEFDDVVTNVGNGYDPRHGHFTAPVAGLYSFSSTALLVTSDSHAAYMYLAIVKNGVFVGHLYSISAYDHGPRTVVLSLAVGDMVWVRNNGDNSPTIDGGGFSTFSGFLITPFSQGN